VPTWRASSVVFLYSPRGLSADVGNGEISSARDWPRRRRDPDGSDATSPLNCCRGGVADYSWSVNCSGISRSGPVSASFS
jgi:hypothetical protein